MHLSPVHFVAGLGSDVTYTCFAVNVEWLLNGTSLSSLQLDDVFQASVSVDNVPVGSSLVFRSVPVEYNNTMIQCSVNTRSHDIIIITKFFTTCTRFVKAPIPLQLINNLNS